LSKKAKKREIGQCGLCQAPNVPLCKSHIIPKAIAKWAKSKAGEEGRKAFWDINNRRLIQDFHSIPMLCECCDNVRFGQRENKFVRNIFKPYQDQQQTNFTYDEWLRYYAVSEGWRLLHHLLDLIASGSMEGLKDKLLKHLRSSHTRNVYETWRDYLLDNQPDPATEQYIYFFNHHYRLPGVNWCGPYALEARYGKLVDAKSIFGDDRFALISQTYGILLVCAVTPPEWPELKGAEIEPLGTLTISTHGRPPELLTSWIHRRMQELQEYMDKTRPKGIP